MIRRILTYYAASLDEYLHHKFPQPEGMAEVGFIGSGAGEKPCKLIVSLVNIERETAGGLLLYMTRNDTPSRFPYCTNRYFLFSRIPILNWMGRNIR